jgi:hypothetical protein
MNVIRSFKEMAAMHKAGEVPLIIVQEITAVLLGLCGYTKDIPEPIEVTQQEIDWLLAMPDDIEFMRYMGGNVLLVETAADLQQVTGMDIEFGKLHGRWPNVTEMVLAWDDCRYLLNSDGTADYALLFEATNNAGGPSWFIRQQHWELAQIDKQIKAHQQFWSKSEAAA